MPDAIIKIAREHGYAIEALVAHLQTKKRPDDQRIVDLRAMTEAAEQSPGPDYS